MELSREESKAQASCDDGQFTQKVVVDLLIAMVGAPRAIPTVAESLETLVLTRIQPRYAGAGVEKSVLESNYEPVLIVLLPLLCLLHLDVVIDSKINKTEQRAARANPVLRLVGFYADLSH